MLCPLNGESKKNVFRRIICSFTITDQICGDSENRCLSCLHYFRPPEEQKYGQIWRPHSEPYKFLLHILKNNSAAENCSDVRLGQVVNLSIFYNIWNSWLQIFYGFDFSLRWRDSEIKPPIQCPYIDITIPYCTLSFSCVFLGGCNIVILLYTFF